MDINKPILRANSRLSHLAAMIQPPYQTIWDCCCDHGQLGMSLLKDSVADQVIFVDVLENIMAELTDRLIEDFPPAHYSWQVRCDDIKNIQVPAEDSQLFIIAGVGPDQSIEFIKSLCASAPETAFDLLLCSVHGNYAVREVLIAQGYRLKEERIIFDKNRFYEAIYASKKADQPLRATGQQMWDWTDPVHRDYWQRTVGHYRQKAKKNQLRYQPVIQHYETLRDALQAALKDNPEPNQPTQSE